jgi:hypothetical protein
MNQQPDTSTTQGKIAVMTAAEEGKRIQWSVSCTHWNDCTSPDTPSWSWGELTYRIHPDDLNPPDPYQHLKDALAAGKRIRLKSNAWFGSAAWFGMEIAPKFHYPAADYEIEPEPEPALGHERRAARVLAQAERAYFWLYMDGVRITKTSPWTTSGPLTSRNGGNE